ncbi:MAG: type II toxin-antitoxin system VapC family toxin [Acidobacteriaceae bacterium]|nr:type II toxin-antitoxin system VapC family toxin [Acidobacteriaceae bacterium]MBV9226515.1 type II toxin-antitoxin system VapC family toxin [Acidobacteriaceae bacterium]MBV9307990.1 type II toxin-antitoxin system VapC family toxin [Acidobacteriaceae bacterium]
MIVDSDLLIDYLRGWEPARDRLQQASAVGQLQTTVINQFELLSGARQPEEEQAVRELLETLDIITLDVEASGIAGRLRRDLLAIGQDIGMADSLIAGIALARSLTLITRNRKHFKRVPNLKLILLEST